MIVRAYSPIQDLDQIKSWLADWNMSSELIEQLPEIGFVARDQEGSIAAGFLRRVEGGLVLLDSLIANPKASGKRRSYALDRVVEALLEKAREFKWMKVLAFTKERAILKRSVKHGFQVLNHVVIGIEMSKGEKG